MCIHCLENLYGESAICWTPTNIVGSIGFRVVHSDFRMGGDWSPPIGGGGHKGPHGGDWRVIRDTSMIGSYK